MAITDIPEYAHLSESDVEALAPNSMPSGPTSRRHAESVTPATSATRSASNADSSSPVGR